MVSAIVAFTRDQRIVGHKNQMLWHIALDMRKFQRVTQGAVCFVGYSTFKSIQKIFEERNLGPIILPWRQVVILTANHADEMEVEILNKDYSNCMVARNKKEAFEKAALFGNENIIVIGGPQIYALFQDEIEKWYATLVDLNLEEGDARLFEFEPNLNVDGEPIWELVLEEHHPENVPPFTFTEYERVAK